MKRLWLLESASGAAGAASEAAGRFPQPLGDPRDVAAARVQADDAAVGQWHLGRLEMDIERTAEGVAASRIVSRAPSFRIEGSGSWSVGEGGRQITRLSARLQGSDIKEMLGELGFDPAIEGESAHVALDLSWPGGPAADFMEHASGRIALEMKNGQVLDLEPGGGGRLLGLLSVAALPRRLALDFSDVFKQGLAFDMIKGDFHVGSGSAYTCNLGLTGPAADIGMVGRTGFGARDYDQIAVVRPQVSNVLTVGGVVLGGPVGGVTMLLISQIFRKPLGTLGESYYRVSGGWDSPDVLRVERSQVDAAEFKDCEREVTAALESGAIALPREAVPGDAPVRGAPRPGDSSP